MPPITVHLIVRATAHGIFARSPQCPGLAFARDTVSEVKDATHGVLSFYFGEPGPFVVLGHEENSLDLDGEEVVVRCAADRDYRTRTRVAKQILVALHDPTQRAELLTYPSDRTGEHLFIAVVAADSLGWIAEQLDDNGDPAVIAAPATDQFIWTNLVGYGESAAALMPVPSESAADLPRGAATTVAEMMRTDLGHRRPLVLSRA